MQRKCLTFLRQMVYKELMTDKLPKCVPNHYFLEMLVKTTHTYIQKCFNEKFKYFMTVVTVPNFNEISL